MVRTVTTESLYLEGEERFGPLTSFLYGIGSAVLNRYYEVIVEDLRGRKFSNLLDVGCGNGALLGKIALNFPDARLKGVDPSPYMLNRAKRNLERKGFIGRVEVKNGSSRVVPFEEKFDAILSSFSYHHWIERDVSLTSLASHLDEKGFLAIYEYDNSSRMIKSSHGINQGEWNDLEIEGLKKTINHKAGLIILTLSK